MKKYSLLIACVWAAMLSAQTVPNYICDFEDPLQNAQWVLNPGTFGEKSPNKWYIGTATQNGGKNSLYISSSKGDTANYTNSSYCMMAYTEITLEAGTYQLGFDWKAMGADRQQDQLMVFWVPQRLIGPGIDEEIVISCIGQNSIPANIAGSAIELTIDERTYLNGSYTWNTCETSFETDGAPHRLLFVWHNGASLPVNPAACVDNITIVNEMACSKPERLSVSVEGSAVKASWQGDAEKYEIRWYSHATQQWKSLSTTTTSAILGDVDEGYCDFYVQSICADGVVSINSSLSQFIYYPVDRCIDYLTLTDENCYTSEGFGSTSDKITYVPGKVDEGYEEANSRHTVHWLREETDPRTGGALKTVPDGEIASVRLGNWNTGAQTERVEFSFKVDTTLAPVLLMKYAVVLENPGHGAGADPRFTLRVLKDNKTIGPCAQADFTSSAQNVADWNIYQPSSNGVPVVWKDWTTVGVNLSEYQGEELTIQLNTFDCSQSGHYGYAYFTLACSDGKMTGINCGDIPTEHFTAPDGFKYRWYRKDNPDDFLSFDQTFYVDQRDTLTYGCDLMFPKDTTCYFTLYASALPRYPIVEGTWKAEQKNCSNIVTFDNTSHIMTVNQITRDSVHRFTEKCERVYWDFGDGTQSTEYSPVHVYPSEGGTFHVTQKAAVSFCEETREFDIVLPELKQTVDTLHPVTCAGTAWSHRGTPYWETGIYRDTLQSVAGCDSLIVIDLKVVEKIETLIDTTIMSDQTFRFDGRDLSEGGVYTVVLKNVTGCDSTVTLDLKVHGLLKVKMDSVFSVCADEPAIHIPFAITQGAADAYSMTFVPERLFANKPSGEVPLGEIVLPLPEDVIPLQTTAQIVFYDSAGVDWQKRILLEVCYPDSVITQRWNDVLAVRNNGYNGGYNFTAWQWYKNGQPLPGATGHYLYEPQGLDLSAEYAVLLTRLEDGAAVMSCPVVPQYFDAARNIPTLVDRSAAVAVQNNVQEAVWIDAVGNRLQGGAVRGGYTQAPALPGIYILTLTDDKAVRTSHRILVR